MYSGASLGQANDASAFGNDDLHLPPLQADTTVTGHSSTSSSLIHPRADVQSEKAQTPDISSSSSPARDTVSKATTKEGATLTQEGESDDPDLDLDDHMEEHTIVAIMKDTVECESDDPDLDLDGHKEDHIIVDIMDQMAFRLLDWYLQDAFARFKVGRVATEEALLQS